MCYNDNEEGSIMLLNFKVKGFKVFNEEVSLSYEANKKIKNKDCVFKINGKQILKSNIVYGSNNTGKSALIEAIDCLKKIVKNGKITDKLFYEFDFNFFSEQKEISYEIEFLEKNIIYKYFLSFIYEEGINNERLYADNQLIFDKNEENEDDELNSLIELYKNYNNILIISTLPKKYKNHTENINCFFDKMMIINKNSTSIYEVIGEVAELNMKDFQKFNNIMKAADVSINKLTINNNFDKKHEQLKLFSEYIMNNRKKAMPSILSDSDGTLVFMIYILRILQLLKSGGILIADEIDRSLHTLLTKNIISIFNDNNNNNIQLLATSHDLLLLDCLYLFRKDQIWFTYKDNKKVYLYCLDKFKSNVDHQIRNKTMESYLKGLFGALPHPNIEEYIFDE